MRKIERTYDWYIFAIRRISRLCDNDDFRKILEVRGFQCLFDFLQFRSISCDYRWLSDVEVVDEFECCSNGINGAMYLSAHCPQMRV